MTHRLPIALILLAGLATLAACATTAPAPELVLGDAWDYRLTSTDLPAGWALSEQTALTALDVARSPITATAPITATPASLQNVQQIYTARYALPEGSEYADFTLQLLLYPTVADAQAGIMAESPGEGWEKVDAPVVGEQSQVWRFRGGEAAGVDQGLYRVDLRHLNAVASLTMLGSAKALPGPDEPLTYARKVLEKLTAGADPAALRQLRQAGLPDLRARLLGQAQLAGLDAVFGDRWVVSEQYLGSWTLNEDFGGEARATLDRLGRVAGYQLYLVKPVDIDEYSQVAGSALFQQVSAYRQADSAERGLKAMIGLTGVFESPVPPRVGEGTRAWSQVMKSADGSSISVTEISFHLGRYVATVQLQSPPLAEDADQRVALADNLALATKLALALADNLAK
jgi:hypothetical protein